jgi:hypothetical protein
MEKTITAGMVLVPKTNPRLASVRVRSASAKTVTLRRDGYYSGFRKTVADVVENYTTTDGETLVAPVEKIVVSTEPSGTCAVCGANQQTRSGGRMVDHGYRIPEAWHSRTAGCPGVGYPAYELSTDGAVAYANGLASSAKSAEKRLASLLDGTTTSLVVAVRNYDRKNADTTKTVTPANTEPARGHYDGSTVWDVAKRGAIAKTERELVAIANETKRIAASIAAWTPKPLLPPRAR